MKKATAHGSDLMSAESEYEAKKTAYFSAMRDGQISEGPQLRYPEIYSGTIGAQLKIINFPIVEVSRRMLGRI